MVHYKRNIKNIHFESNSENTTNILKCAKDWFSSGEYYKNISKLETNLSFGSLSSYSSMSSINSDY